MTENQIKKKVLAFGDWEWWAERPFGAFMMSFFEDGQKRELHRRIGVDAEWTATLMQRGGIYKSHKVWNIYAAELRKYLKSGGSVEKIVQACLKHKKDSEKEIKRMLRFNEPVLQKFAKFNEIISLVLTFCWLAHGLEHIYKPMLYKEAAKYVPKKDLDKFVGDISYPSKHNEHWYLEQALRSNQPLRKIQERFAWIKCRDGFSDGFSLAELKAEQAHLRKTKPAKFIRPKVPQTLKDLVETVQELVYFRTLRTDVWFELQWLARPIYRDVAKFYHVPFQELRNYRIQDLLAGKPKKYPRYLTWISYGKEVALFKKPILNDKYSDLKEIKGLIANHGIATGRAKIVRTAHEIGKIKQGDILFAPTTAPSFVIGMKKAAAYVTDEGGITSHAAIVSRELHKPCIIGTKIATKIFKDGDLVEVDANKGIVRKLN